MDADLVGRTQERERLAGLLERARGGQRRDGAGQRRRRRRQDAADRRARGAPGTLVLRGAAVQGRTAPVRPARRGAARPPARAPRRARRRRPAARPPRAAAARARRAGRRAPTAPRCSRRCAPRFAAIARDAPRRGRARRPAVERRGDARRSLAALGDVPLLVVGVYRSDGLPRQHPIRRLRHDLRRAGRLEEIVLRPLDLPQTAELLRRTLGREPAPSLARAIHDRTRGPAVLRRGARDRAARQRRASRPGGAAWSWPATATCRCPTPCATPS